MRILKNVVDIICILVIRFCIVQKKFAKNVTYLNHFGFKVMP